jgi:DNA invertase Pin-like site-specific DNA recombinase
MKIGYARVSSYGQSLDIQLNKLEEAGCEKIFSEKASGVKESRKEFNAMLDFAREGDQIVVTRLDRLSRSLLELQKTSKILENKTIDLKILEQDIDTSTPSGRLLFNIVGVVAEFEREMINQRAAEGRKVAKENGVKFGAKKKLSDRDIESIKNLIAMGESKAELAKLYGVGRSTLYRALEKE